MRKEVWVEADEGEGCAVVGGVEMTDELLGVVGVVEVVEGIEDVRVDDEVEEDEGRKRNRSADKMILMN